MLAAMRPSHSTVPVTSQRVQQPVGGNDPLALADDGDADTLQLPQEVTLRELHAEPGDGLELVERPRCARARARTSCRRSRRRRRPAAQDERDLVAHAAAGVLVEHGSAQHAQLERLAAVDHGPRQPQGLVVTQAAQHHGHEQRAGLIGGDGAADHALDERAHARLVELVAVALPRDHVVHEVHVTPPQSVSRRCRPARQDDVRETGGEQPGEAAAGGEHVLVGEPTAAATLATSARRQHSTPVAAAARAFHRLLAFARRPAPVQVEWIGYFHSTGMKSMDYFITDPNTTPPGGGQLFTENPVYMPHTRFCYSPPEYSPDVASAPVEKSGSITFGSFNRLPKMTDEVVMAWARILDAVPDSRLVVKSGALADTTVMERLTTRFAKLGIKHDRLELRENSSHAEMFMEYGDIDIALDTFPFNGGMTTLEALWMGVPVVTVAGNTVVSRQTVSALANIGLADELAFPDIEAYIQGAVALASDRTRLVKLRQEIRPRMTASPLCQPEQFVRDLEGLYIRMWEAWCRGEKLSSDISAVSTEVSA